MEQWEIDLRAKLGEEIKDGGYQIGSGKWIVWTGKLGYINYLVEVQRSIRDTDDIIKMFKVLFKDKKNGDSKTN